LLALVALGCSGSSTPDASPTPRTPPDLAAFLRLPVATPSACASTVSGSTSGRRSPWVGHVDVSVFLAASTGPPDLRRVRRTLDALPAVRHIYYESRRKAYAEFQRLYTCSAEVPARSVPASYRLVLAPVTQPERDDLVRSIRALDGVRSVSCDPSNPCVDSAAGPGRR
jgi:cell division protein FtsX